jgi:hypothetical protein
MKQARMEASSSSADPLLVLAKSRCKSLFISSTDASTVIDLRGRHDVMQALANNKWLRRIDFRYCKLNEQEVAVLMQSNTIDTILGIDKENELAEKMCESLASNRHLTWLTLHGAPSIPDPRTKQKPPFASYFNCR